jgi:hypothetical protein
MMEINKVLDKKIKRQGFFITAGTGIAGFFLMRLVPFGSLLRKRNGNNEAVNVKLNPDAVSREKTGRADGRK